MTDTSGSYLIDSLWIKYYGQLFSMGCGECPMELDYANNVVNETCKEFNEVTKTCLHKLPSQNKESKT